MGWIPVYLQQCDATTYVQTTQLQWKTTYELYYRDKTSYTLPKLYYIPLFLKVQQYGYGKNKPIGKFYMNLKLLSPDGKVLSIQ